LRLCTPSFQKGDKMKISRMILCGRRILPLALLVILASCAAPPAVDWLDLSQIKSEIKCTTMREFIGDPEYLLLTDRSTIEEFLLPDGKTIAVLTCIYGDELDSAVNRGGTWNGDYFILEKVEGKYRIMENIYGCGYAAKVLDGTWYIYFGVRISPEVNFSIAKWQDGNLEWIGSRMQSGSESDRTIEDHGIVPSGLF
jgi:hypothetical protein